ncbi:sodium:alanine symporter [Betaproteobacteria bacterium]|nr:sodium:alanine symporter [Betaproteobacteria bacterium]GHU07085.1 sodium:alanine symporter [Betaproteobacteria bacterium]GHU21517.1 sodium:alanine symporter [Betaproteobacteria bacterium]GHU27679.1 sodium:alanine symporter [Betaproteobacteria bacterium]
METLTSWLDTIDDLILGGPVLVPFLVFAGIFLSFGLRFVPWRKWPHAFVTLWRGRHRRASDEGELSPFRALMLSLSATIGVGNIVGVAGAILLGGPGAVFWMWVIALLGMAVKFCEATLAVKYRDVTPDGKFVGGPMYYIKNGLGPQWKWLASLFAIFGIAASFVVGNMIQTNSISINVIRLFEIYQINVPPILMAIALLFIAAIVLLGGLRHIGAVVGTLVPTMVMLYVIGGLTILALHLDRVPNAFQLIFSGAFNGQAATGGFIGTTVAEAIRFGIARSLLSNEAGLGTSPIAHATAMVKEPVKQGLIGMLGPFFDTIIICSISALVILVSDEWLVADISHATLTAHAFDTAMPGNLGTWLVTITLVLFAFSTVLGWCIYGERCAIYLLGYRAALPFRILFTFLVPVGVLQELALVWKLAIVLCGLMALPNLIALLLLSPVVFSMTKEYFGKPEKADDVRY